MTGILLVLHLAAAGADARSFRGEVVDVHDGDTLTLATDAGQRLRIRLSGIDAPELDQPHGEAARRRLADLALERAALARCIRRDRHGRWLCRVTVAGEDLGLSLLQSGYAWWFRRYAHEQPEATRSRYAAAEAEATRARRGLWQDAVPRPPWLWRREH